MWLPSRRTAKCSISARMCCAPALAGPHSPGVCAFASQLVNSGASQRPTGGHRAEWIWTQRFRGQRIQRADCLFLPAFRWVTAARDLAGLVEPLAIHLDPGGVLLSLRRKLHRIAHLLLSVLSENDLRGGRVAVHDDQRILDRHVECGPLARGRRGDSRRRSNRRRRGSLSRRASRRRRGGTVVCLLDAFLALIVPRAENQFAILGIKGLFSLPVHFAEVVVVTRDLILYQLAVNQ